MDVKVVDYRSPNAPREFTESLRNTGFAVLVNHPINYDDVLQLQSEWLDFFKSERKWEFLPGEGGQDGQHARDGGQLQQDGGRHSCILTRLRRVGHHCLHSSATRALNCRSRWPMRAA